jgi:chemotaxis protein methyltransferase CheR
LNHSSTLDEKTFRRFAELIYREAGIYLAENKKALVSARLGKRMLALGLRSYNEYYEYVQNDRSLNEIGVLIDAISTNVTHFFRESDHFPLLAEIVQRWESEGQRRFRIWCAASSSGEEPYTIALTLAESMTQMRDTKILATDISNTVLQIARQGAYSSKQLNAVPAHLIRKYFFPIESEGVPHYQVIPQLREKLQFSWLNLSAPPFPMKGPLDVVFCRNVMIYFDNNVRQKLVDEICRLLKPGGYLMIGHAESLSGLAHDLRPVRPSVYCRK